MCLKKVTLAVCCTNFASFYDWLFPLHLSLSLSRRYTGRCIFPSDASGQPIRSSYDETIDHQYKWGFVRSFRRSIRRERQNMPVENNRRVRCIIFSIFPSAHTRLVKDGKDQSKQARLLLLAPFESKLVILSYGGQGQLPWEEKENSLGENSSRCPSTCWSPTPTFNLTLVEARREREKENEPMIE